ncbi:MAG TPA: hypothetical protein PK119_00495 [Candidatus Paceibacterota bacterium]|nr:hypothetical protein [Candidatus Paceibacterota bacterium]
MPEKELKIISKRIEEKKSHIEKAGLPAQPEELLVRETISERIEESLKNLPPISSDSGGQPFTSSFAKRADDENQKKLRELVALAFDESIPKAVNLARKTGNFHLIDSLHDKLVLAFIEKINKEKAI